MTTRDRPDRSQELCAVLGHELRNPLAAAVTSVSLAAAQLDTEDPRGAHLRSALDDLGRLSALLTAYLEWGRGGSMQQREVDLFDVLQAVASRDQSLRVESKLDRVGVRVDPDLLGRALENLLENAYQAGADEVIFKVLMRDGAAVVEVADDGPGVPNELQDALFEPFVSGRESSGLGLAVARDVIERQGGRIRFVPPGRRGRGGATFEIVLPVEERAAVGSVVAI